MSEESCFPDCCKVSSVVPVFKNVGKRSTVKNCRRVSLLSVVSKVFEKLLNDRIVDHQEKCGIFSDFQYGFRSFWSTVDLLTVVSDGIALINWVGTYPLSVLLEEVAQYLYKSTKHPCMEYCCHVWAGAPSCYLELLDKLQKWICRTVGLLLAASLKPLAHRRNVISLSLFHKYLADVLQNWLNWFHFLFLVGGLLVILIDCMIFLSPFLDNRRMSMSTVSFLAQLDSGIICL